jgi:hypothetical protein
MVREKWIASAHKGPRNDDFFKLSVIARNEVTRQSITLKRVSFFQLAVDEACGGERTAPSQ